MTELTELFDTVQGCCLHDPQWVPVEVSQILTWKEDKGDYAESETIVIVKLTDGYGLLTESADTTGHGCRCGSMTVREKTLRELLTHLSPHELEWVIGNYDGQRRDDT